MLRWGVGGLPRGRVIEIYGPRVIRQDHADVASRRRDAEEQGGVCAFVDAEHALDVQYAQRLRVCASKTC